MTKLAVFITAILLILFSATLVLAKQPFKPPGQNQTGKPQNTSTSSIQVTNSTPSGEICDQQASWKNHGQYVSCVARNVAGPNRLGGPGNSVAAKSNIGKPAFSPAPTATPSSTPEPQPTPTPTPIESPSPTATPSAETQGGNTILAFSQIINLLEQILEFLKNLLP